MNEEDSEQVALFLDQHGYLPVATPEEADVVLLNTCSVRRKPEEKVYSMLGVLRLLKQQRPEMIVGVCGCMAQIHADDIARRAPHVDFIVGTGHAATVPGLVEQALQRKRSGRPPTSPLMELGLPPRRGATVADVPLRALGRSGSIRAYVPVMYGCDRFCTFCVVPLTRGRERSRPPEEVLSEIRALAAGGTREVTLLGQTVNFYGRNLPGERVSFADLLWRIAGIPGIRRIRFTSPHPRGFTDELIQAIADIPQVCEHVHLPLQVADDDILRAMKRGYTVKQYREILDKLRTKVPGIAITTDIMLGFPGETDDHFRATLEFVRKARFDAAFMFAYSPRPGTRAADLPDQVPHTTKVERLSELIEVQNSITREINAALVGATVEVLVDGPSFRGEEQMSGLTRTFKTVHFSAGTAFPRERRPGPGDVVQVLVEEGGLTGLRGVCLTDGVWKASETSRELAGNVLHGCVTD